MSHLAVALRVDPSTATRAVDRLVQRGLADRRREGDDGRVVEVSLTAAGRRHQQRLLERRRGMLHEVLDGFDERERATLADLLERLVDGVDRYVAATRKQDQPTTV
jgi:DNA-binding MarR family transcriptional regulator